MIVNKNIIKRWQNVSFVNLLFNDSSFKELLMKNGYNFLCYPPLIAKLTEWTGWGFGTIWNGGR